MYACLLVRKKLKITKLAATRQTGFPGKEEASESVFLRCGSAVYLIRLPDARSILSSLHIMAAYPHHLLWLLLLLLPWIPFSSSARKEAYIVFAGESLGRAQADELLSLHHSMLASVKGGQYEAREALLYSYRHSFNGFAAHLSKEEASAISEMEGVVSVFKSNNRRLHTTRSWNFLDSLATGSTTSFDDSTGIAVDLWKQANYGEDIIIGLLDSGIWPESQSFSDEGMAPVPERWKGTCEEGDSFKASHCNRKVIGARYYLKGYEAYYGKLNQTDTPEFRSGRDHDGHGTHTASTAAGRKVDNVSAVGGFAEGQAVGGAPKARLAAYKVCWPLPHHSPADENTCTEVDMLAAIDDAIADGVDILSVSIGSTYQYQYQRDAIALGALYAARAGVLLVASAGNEGPAPATLSNQAPWILTVAASSLDRQFISSLTLGNAITIKGQSVTPYRLQQDKMYPLVFARDAVVTGLDRNNITAAQCLAGSLDPSKVTGKIVFCLRGNGPRVAKGMEVKRAGGAAVVLGNLAQHGNEISVDAYVLPGTAVVADDSAIIMAYINSTLHPTANIRPPLTVTGIKPAPFMAAFSSRGPNTLDPNILKPDMTAPGLNILAAWSGASSPTKLLTDERRVEYNIMSGTSMSCPHVSGVAALIKAVHREWSAAAIKSALMTTAQVRNNEGATIIWGADAGAGHGHAETPLSYGAGQLSPSRALEPGLVYNATFEEYLLYLCSVGVNASGAFHSHFRCPPYPRFYDLNYPSITVTVKEKEKEARNVRVRRVLTSVSGGGLYEAIVEAPPGISLKVVPPRLHFKSSGDRRSFSVHVGLSHDNNSIAIPLHIANRTFVFGSLTWSDGRHRVRSPIAVSLAAA